MSNRFKSRYDDDINLFEGRWHLAQYAILAALLLAAPWVLGSYYLGELTAVLVWSLAGLGLMLISGHTGQVSLGHAAFMAIGAFTNLALMQRGWHFIPALLASAVTSGVAGAIIARPILRMSGIYLAIATLALSIILEDVAIMAEPVTGGVAGVFAPPIELFGLAVDRYATPRAFYYICLAVLVLVTLGYLNLLRSGSGRSFLAVRDSEVSARALGVNVTRAKTLAFSLSCAITGLAGALYGHLAQAVNYESFLVLISITLLLQVVIGGLGSVHGAFFGAIVVVLLPQVIAIARDYLDNAAGIKIAAYPGMDTALFALLILLMVIYEPRGLYGVWFKVRTWLQLFPLYRKGMFRRTRTYLKTERQR
ncbi:ABC transporter permease [Alcanivorax sp. HI0083]|uniref:branched-chain amino acid ABC transporter permease n=1 Tax=unclassified Alcanivorax TaxID=2638842 RepID=UPI0007B93D51|nr:MULTISPECIES: branched-chain amino acid ABC transporter permease [unclassified Alcanivorax]KZY31052.1 ABC transporter permease [Alcanivorax sp. HI0044]KZZ23196.1 ABC transporter permease [Alcanivorax sp. HI0083]PHR66328.1 MAG: branched-chain amino acid ABC transporter permease [Alcanivorax sp.]